MNDYSVTLKSNKTLEVQGSLRTVSQLDALIAVLSGMREIAFQGADHTSTGITHDDQLYDVILKKTGDRKIDVIKEVRNLTGLGLFDAKQLVEADYHRVILRRVSHHVAQRAYRALNEVGATVEFRRPE